MSQGYYVREATGAGRVAARGVRFLAFSGTSIIGAAFSGLMAALREAN